MTKHFSGVPRQGGIVLDDDSGVSTEEFVSFCERAERLFRQTLDCVKESKEENRRLTERIESQMLLINEQQKLIDELREEYCAVRRELRELKGPNAEPLCERLERTSVEHSDPFHD